MAKTDDEQPQDLSRATTCPPWMLNAHAHVMERHHSQRLPHALLLSGPAQLGKVRFAEYLVRCLLCEIPVCLEPGTEKTTPGPCGQCSACAQLNVGTSVEFKRLQPMGKSNTIRIDQIRELVDWLQLAAAANRNRIALIIGADTMNRAAANALLKTLEEPAMRSLCLLVADRPAQLPATIISRCQQVPLRVEDEKAALAWLKEELPPGCNATESLKAAGGAPLRAVQQANPEWLHRRELIDAAWWSLLLHRKSIGRIVESLSDVPLALCLSRFLTLANAAVFHRQGAEVFSGVISLTDEQIAVINRLEIVDWFAIQDQLLRLYRIDSTSFKTQTVLEGFFADTRLKINP